MGRGAGPANVATTIVMMTARMDAVRGFVFIKVEDDRLTVANGHDVRKHIDAATLRSQVPGFLQV